MQSAESVRPKVVVLGPTPPPHHGMTTFTRMLLDSPELARAYEVLHVDTSDRRGLDNMGRLDLANVRLALAHAWRLWRVLAREKPDVVLVQVSQNAWAYIRDATFIAVAKMSGVPVLTHLNGGGFRQFYDSAPAPVRALVRTSSRWIDGAAVLGSRLLPLYDGLITDDRLHVLANGVRDPCAPDSELRAGAAVESAAPELPLSPAAKAPAGDGVVVAYLGMLVESKGYLDLIEAARLSVGMDPRMRFRFAGPWWSPEEERRARKHAEGLAEVAFVGVVGGASKWRFLREADILALPSYYPPEGQPQVLLEAMAAGRPVVATGRGAIPDVVVDGETGFLVPERDPVALAAALRRLARDPALRRRMGAAARARFEAHFTAARCAERLVEILDSIRVGRGAERAE